MSFFESPGDARAPGRGTFWAAAASRRPQVAITLDDLALAPIPEAWRAGAGRRLLDPAGHAVHAPVSETLPWRISSIGVRCSTHWAARFPQ
jgi:hypothetical protein